MEKKEQDRFPEMAFPGMSKVLDVLPHPGKMFLEFFKIYNRIDLRPISLREYKSICVILGAFKGNYKISGYGSEGNDAVFFLNKEVCDFYVQAGHGGLEWEKMREKRKTFIFNKVHERLEEYRFCLQIRGYDTDRISDPEKFVSYFWAPSSFKDVKIAEQSFIDINIVGIQNGQIKEEIKGMDFSNPRHLRWGSLIPHNTVHYKVIETAALWQENWRNIKQLVGRGVEVDLEKNWQKCQKDIRTELTELVKFEELSGK